MSDSKKIKLAYEAINVAHQTVNSLGTLADTLSTQIEFLFDVIKNQELELNKIGNTINEQCDTIHDLENKIKELQAAN